MADVILKNAIGEEVTYEGVKVVKLNTSDGQQAFTEGEPEEKTVDLDFTNGDMVVTPSEGKMLTRVDIVKPEELVPENIKENKVVAGVKGVLSAGSPPRPAMFMAMTTTGSVKNKGTVDKTLSYSPPAGSTIYGVFEAYANLTNSSTAFNGKEKNAAGGAKTYTVIENDNGTITVQNKKSMGSTSYYTLDSWSTVIIFAVEGFTLVPIENGNKLVVSNSVTEMPPATTGTYSLRPHLIEDNYVELDFSESQIESFAVSEFAYTKAKRILFPSTINTFNNYAFRQFAGTMDFTRSTKVPDTAPTTVTWSECEVLVPAALYSEWIAHSQWSSYKSYIKAV